MGQLMLRHLPDFLPCLDALRCAQQQVLQKKFYLPGRGIDFLRYAR